MHQNGPDLQARLNVRGAARATDPRACVRATDPRACVHRAFAVDRTLPAAGRLGRRCWPTRSSAGCAPGTPRGALAPGHPTNGSCRRSRCFRGRLDTRAAAVRAWRIPSRNYRKYGDRAAQRLHSATLHNRSRILRSRRAYSRLPHPRVASLQRRGQRPADHRCQILT